MKLFVTSIVRNLKDGWRFSSIHFSRWCFELKPWCGNSNGNLAGFFCGSEWAFGRWLCSTVSMISLCRVKMMSLLLYLTEICVFSFISDHLIWKNVFYAWSQWIKLVKNIHFWTFWYLSFGAGDVPSAKPSLEPSKIPLYSENPALQLSWCTSLQTCSSFWMFSMPELVFSSHYTQQMNLCRRAFPFLSSC